MPGVFNCAQKCYGLPYKAATIVRIENKRHIRDIVRNVEARSRNHYCRGKAMSITYSECVSVALVIRHAKRMRRIVLPSVACLALPYFNT